MTRILAIAAGGALGSVTRYWLSGVVGQALGRGFPWGTLAVNVLGCLLVGLAYVLVVEKWQLGAVWRLAILIGFLGGFTTFSTFSLETLGLLENGQVLRAIANMAASLLICLLAAWAGMALGRQL